MRADTVYELISVATQKVFVRPVSVCRGSARMGKEEAGNSSYQQCMIYHTLLFTTDNSEEG